MKVGDLVVSSTNPDTSEIGIIVGQERNGDWKVRFEHGTFTFNPIWLEVLCK